LSGFKVLDANGQSLAYVYGRETKADADITNVLTMDEARRIAAAQAAFFCVVLIPRTSEGRCLRVCKFHLRKH
jgi:hypothetical protein